MTHRVYALSSYTRQHFGERVQKIPLDAGFSCPNRDGFLSRSGCIFCNPKGSGSGFEARGLDIPEQWKFWSELHSERHDFNLFSAYLQSYSNTYGPIEKLENVLGKLKGLPGLTTLNIGTRPDCLDEAKLDLLATQKDKLGLSEVTLELGLQSSCDETLAHINRGHTTRAFAEAARAAADRGIIVAAHVIAGLPTPHGREGRAELLATVDFINRLPIHAIKFHNLYVCNGTPLAELYKEGQYHPMTQLEYLSQLSDALMRLKPTTVVHRLNGNPSQGDLIAPKWAGNMRALHNAVRTHLDANDIWQGKHNGAEDGPKDWYSPDYAGTAPC